MTSQTSSTARRAALAALALTLACLYGCNSSEGETPPPSAALRGRVASGDQPLPGLNVTLYAAGAAAPQVLGEASSGAQGDFSIDYLPPQGRPVLYAVARGAGNSPIALMSVLGGLDSPPRAIVVNELTTVASVWTAAQFLEGGALSGNEVGLRNAAGNVGNLIDVSTGDLGAALLSGVNIQTTTLAKFSSLGDLLGACVRGDCSGLLANATAPDGTVPRDTLEAAINIARNPWSNVEGLYALLPPPPDKTTPIADVPYTPYLRYQPGDWTLSLVYTGGGLDAPGGVAIDADGFVWTNNNFLVGSQSFLGERGFPGLGATKLTPNGTPLSPPSGFGGGGIYGAGFGIAIDPRGHIWIGNFAGSSLSELAADGAPISPAGTGYPAPGQIQGTAVDQLGNVWVANFSAGSVTEYPVGRPGSPRTFGGASCAIQIVDPFGVAVDGDGKVWVASQGTDSIVEIDPAATEACPVDAVPVGRKPFGVAVDARGNVWAANLASQDVTLYDRFSKQTAQYGAGSFTGPWGIAVDAAGNVWVADFFGQRLVEICGAAGNCPPGYATGQLISPPPGYSGGGGVQHITDVAVDQAGNVWVLNNNNDQALCDAPPPTDSAPSRDLEAQSMSCGGNGAVVFFGVAAPVAAPLLGPPREP